MTTVLLLGPLGTTADVWADTARLLSPRHQPRAVDVPLGGADCTDLDRFADTLLALVPDRGQAVVVGVGFGACLALAVALREPATVAGLVLAAGTACPSDPAAWLDRAARVRASGLGDLAPAIAERWDVPADQADRTLAMLAGVDAAAYADCCELASTIDLRPRLPEVACPALVVRAGADRALPADHTTDLVAGLRLVDEVVLARAGHLAMLAPELAHLVLAFAEELGEPVTPA
ncbi:alpha/beta hydrolase [Aeromicrobium sp. NPDC092404]|uniref:alpha/beta fold hydrolase n=1 Tax=Aeromicrobium sp. NPDC092404 TaxID=3154976 RepID=UPI00341399CC